MLVAADGTLIQPGKWSGTSTLEKFGSPPPSDASKLLLTPSEDRRQWAPGTRGVLHGASCQSGPRRRGTCSKEYRPPWTKDRTQISRRRRRPGMEATESSMHAVYQGFGTTAEATPEAQGRLSRVSCPG